MATTRGALQFQGLFTEVLTNFLSVNPASLIDAAGATIAVSVPGAALGDFVMFAAPYDLQDITVTAYVQAAGLVELRLQNEGGATIDLAAGNWKVMVLKPNLAFFT